LSTYGTAFCVDVPAITDARAVHATIRGYTDDPSHTRTFVTTAHDGLIRLLVDVGSEMLGSRADSLAGQIGTGRVAVAENCDEYGAEWRALRVVEGTCTIVHQHQVLPVDPTDLDEVREFHRYNLVSTMSQTERGLLAERPEPDPDALAAFARSRTGDPDLVDEDVLQIYRDILSGNVGARSGRSVTPTHWRLSPAFTESISQPSSTRPRLRITHTSTA
jgi:hypothetical protein